MLKDPEVLVNIWNNMTVGGLQLRSPWEYQRSQAVVISGPTAESAVLSAQAQGLTVQQFESYNLVQQLPESYHAAVEIRDILVPTSHTDTSWVQHVRLLNHRMEYFEVARIFDHMTAWNHCISIGQPVVVLESAARLRSLPGQEHFPRNSIIGLDTQGQWHRHTENYPVMPGVWAYAIDQSAAKHMFNRVLSQGIRDPLELMFRADQQLILLADHAYK